MRSSIKKLKINNEKCHRNLLNSVAFLGQWIYNEMFKILSLITYRQFNPIVLPIINNPLDQLF